MRRLGISLLLALCINTVHAAPPVGIILTVGQWMLEGQRRVYQVDVNSVADTADQARQTAFRLAVEQAVGTIIVSESESTNQQLKRDDIITYASGYVDRYEILQQRNVPGGVELKMRVWVAHSAIANRLLNQSKETGRVDGDRASVQVETLQAQRQSGDQLINAVLQDYPRRAFDIVLEPAQITFDQSRQALLQIPFRISWNKLYLTSLTEALKAVNQYPQCAGMYGGCKNVPGRVEVDVNLFSPNPGAWFNDNSLHIFRNNMDLDAPAYRLTMWAHGRPIIRCFRAHELDNSIYSPQYFATIAPSVVTIHGRYSSRVILGQAANSLPLKDLGKIEVDVVRRSQCQDLN